jgi:hypothetical protein
MIPDDLRDRMRRLFFAEHWDVRAISAELGVHYHTVRRVIEASRSIHIESGAQASVLDPDKSFVELTLEVTQ